MNWATNHDASLEGLRRVQGSLTVDLIMAPRSSFRTCTPNETAAQVKGRNADGFSYFPVIDDDGRIVGLYRAEQWFHEDAPDSTIGEDFERLSEEIVIGADASIFDFVMQADTKPTNLVVSGNKIAGLISLSDLQQLPVRAALFALITSLEMAMAARIDRHWADQPDGWHNLLDDSARKALEKKVLKAKSDDSFVGSVVLSQFSDKSRVAWEAGFLGGHEEVNHDCLDKIRLLRNDLAHGNQFAETPSKAREVCGLVRTIMKIKETLVE
jgi:CBS domain-containing protein